MSNKHKNILFFCLTMLFSFVIPVLIVMIKYKMFEAFFKAKASIQFSIIGCLIILILTLVNVKKIIKFLNDMPLSPFKCIINGVFKLIPLTCIMLILINMESALSNLKFVVGWFLGCNAISFFIFEPLWRHYSKEYHLDLDYAAWHKRELQQKEKEKELENKNE